MSAVYDAAAIEVQRRINEVRDELPASIEEPVVRKLDPATRPIMTLTLSAEVGRRDVTLRELLGMGLGSTIELGRTVTQPIELWVGSRRIAEADAVVVNDRLGVRLRGSGHAVSSAS